MSVPSTAVNSTFCFIQNFYISQAVVIFERNLFDTKNSHLTTITFNLKITKWFLSSKEICWIVFGVSVKIIRNIQ